MSVTWQKQLLFKDYSGVGGRGRKKGKRTDGLMGDAGRQEKKKEAEKDKSNLSHASFVNQ